MATAKERHPQVYVERYEDPRKRKRTVPMEVLSLGWSRTGTMTMKAAFETLGIPTWHWVTQSENTPDLAMWQEALMGKYEPESGTKPSSEQSSTICLGIGAQRQISLQPPWRRSSSMLILRLKSYSSKGMLSGGISQYVSPSPFGSTAKIKTDALDWLSFPKRSSTALLNHSYLSPARLTRPSWDR